MSARVTETLRSRTANEADLDAELFDMASDPEIQREIAEIERDFRITEFDGLD